MELPKYVFSEKQNGPNQLIVCTAYPFPVFELSMYTNPERWDDRLAKEKRIHRTVKNYKVIVCLKTVLENQSLSGNGLKVLEQLDDLVNKVLPEKMQQNPRAYRNRIQIDRGYRPQQNRLQ